jgi:hypothetical protein
MYIGLLKSRYPKVPWHPGTSLLAPTTFSLPKFPFMKIKLSLPVPGNIVYSATPDYGEAALVGLTVAAVSFMALTLNSGAVAPLESVPVPRLAF